jgi:hypothetical protein
LPDYYQILNLPNSATLDDLKHAYRKLAHEFHPDVSKLPNARELFIELNEAYEYLLNRIHMQQELKQHKAASYNETAQSIIDTWMAGERERIRNRAKMHADMKFRNFKKTRIYRTTEILTNYLNMGTLVLGITVLLGAVIGTWQHLLNEHNTDLSYIASAFIVAVLGVSMTFYSIVKIRNSKRSNRHYLY